ncbi:F-box/kelch-repeat protein At3g23880-like [Salvia miltiorrhiza]|uniref:F-box/kelch-repeat protein At3g23880-like n=1 Tax=Salvia miltiorrhiza TaxID=226208 RepID=UPI0025AC7253|nr:F-box/kelch-repeat protein At3g23880-like [Salvia miltiorrhiza]
MEIAERSKKSLHLPEQIIEEILSRLPVKSLLRLRCVSKSWRSLIGSKRFIKTQHQNSIKNPSFPQQRVFLLNRMYLRLEQCSMQSILSELLPRSSPLDDPMITTLMRFQIWGCYNGLLCVFDTHLRIHLWNPSTKISKKLPEISHPLIVRNYGFGWVESSDDYKVFVLSRVNHQCNWVGKVYSSKTKSWKTIRHCADLLSCCKEGVFVGGKLYWKKIGDEEDMIFLDLKSEVFGRIELPFDHEYCAGKNCWVGVLGDCLCVLYSNTCSYCERGVRVWVMKESWERVATLAHLVELLQQPQLVVGEKGEILVDCGSTLLVYNYRDDVFGYLVVHRPYILRHVYVESLVSPEDMC